MTFRELYKNSVIKLNNGIIDDADFEARILLQHCFKMSYTDYIIRADENADENNILLFNNSIEKRLQNFPLQYIIGEWDFYGRTFKVGEGVLIPRPETELLVDEVVKFCKASHKSSVKIFDLCSGSGCIGLTIAKEIHDSEVWCIEKSDKAFKYLSENAELLSAQNVMCIQGDILEGFESFNLPKPDIIISNPPYIRSCEIPELQTEVQFEPRMALDGGMDGYVFYRVLSEKWLPFIEKDGGLFVECGEGQAEYIKELLNRNETVQTEIIQDFQKINRIVCAFTK